MTTDLVAAIIGYVLFAISEILPLINVPTNGFLQTLLLGFKDAFKNPEKDIELAQILIHSKPDYANIVNTLSTNHVVQNIVQDLVQNPRNINNITAVQSQTDIASVVSSLRNNPALKNIVVKLVSDPPTYNSICALLSNPTLSDPIIQSLLANPSIQANPSLLDAFKIPGITTNIQQLLQNPQLSDILNTLANDPAVLTNVANTLQGN